MLPRLLGATQYALRPGARWAGVASALAGAALLAATACDGASDEPVEPSPAAAAMATAEPAATRIAPAAAPATPSPSPDPTQTTDAARQWRELSPLAAGPRQETAVVGLDGEVWVIGGFDARGRITDRIEIYDPATDSWRTGPSLPLPMHHVNAAAVDGKLYVLGFLIAGFAADGRSFVYDRAVDAWTEVSAMPSARRRGASGVAVDRGRIYVLGGLRGGAVADASVYDPASDRWSALPDMPRPADHLVAGAIDGVLYAAGGRSGGITGHTARVDAFDIAEGAWSEVTSMPTSRGGTAGAVQGGRLYVFGGEGNQSQPSGVFASAEAYDPATDTWEVLPPMRTPRHGTGAAAVRDAIYVPGGATTQAFGAVDANEVLAVTP